MSGVGAEESRTSCFVDPRRDRSTFARRGDKVVFEFRHFVEPARIVGEYVAANAYGKTRLARVDKKKLSKIRRESEELPDEAKAETKEDPNAHSSLRQVKAPGRLKKTNASVPAEDNRRMYKFRERVSATKNIVFEFRPDGNDPPTVTETDNPAKLPAARRASKKNVTGRRKRSTTLPKLHSVASAPNYDARITNVDISEKSSLPGLNRHESSNKSSTGREDEMVKSNWQILKERKNWIHGKAATTNLYEKLERVNKCIDEMQRPFVEQSGDECPRRGASIAIGAPRSLRLEDEAARTEEEILSRRCPARSSESRGRRTKNGALDPPKRSSLAKNLKGTITFCSHEAKRRSTCEGASRASRSIEGLGGLPRARGEIDAAKYLDEYGAENLKAEEKNVTEFRIPSRREVEDILASLNLRKCGFSEDDEEDVQEDFENREDTLNIEKSKDVGTEVDKVDPSWDDLKKSYRDVRLGNSRGTGNGIEDDIERKNEKSTKNEEEPRLGGRTFLKIALDGSKDRIPEHFRSRIEKSNYLRAHPDLKPV